MEILGGLVVALILIITVLVFTLSRQSQPSGAYESVNSGVVITVPNTTISVPTITKPGVIVATATAITTNTPTITTIAATTVAPITVAPPTSSPVSTGTTSTTTTGSISLVAPITLTGHTNWVNAVAFSPDSQTLVSGGFDNTVNFWNSKTWGLTNTLPCHESATKVSGNSPLRVYSIAFSPDGKYLAVGCNDGFINIIEISSGKSLNSWQTSTGSVNSLAFNSDNHTLASGGDNGVITLWDLKGIKINALPRTQQQVETVVFSPDGKLLASAGDDRIITLWNVQNPEKVIEEYSQDQKQPVHQGPIFLLAFNRGGSLLASAGFDGTIRTWQLTSLGSSKISLSSQHIFNLAPTIRVNSVAFDPTGLYLASGSSDGTVRLWDTTLVKEIDKKALASGPINSVAFSPDGNFLAAATSANQVILWQIKRQ